MAKSYKKEVMDILQMGYSKTITKINGVDVEVYCAHKEFEHFNFDEVAKREGLKGKTKPVCIIQYFTVAPWAGRVIPMIAFIWSWGGPWAYVYNINYPELSESGSVPMERLRQSANI